MLAGQCVSCTAACWTLRTVGGQSKPCVFSSGNQDLSGCEEPHRSSRVSSLSPLSLQPFLGESEGRGRGKQEKERGEGFRKDPQPGNSPLAFYLQQQSPGFIEKA